MVGMSSQERRYLSAPSKLALTPLSMIQPLPNGLSTKLIFCRFNTSTDATGGYTPDGNVTAITMLHESGTGGSPKYGIIPSMPLASLEGANLLDNLTYMQPRTGNDSVSVGYYKSNWQNGVTVELSASMHAGLMQSTYPMNGDAYVLVHLSHYLPTQNESVAEQMYGNGHIDLSNDGRQYSGYGVWRGGWNEGTESTHCGKGHVAD